MQKLGIIIISAYAQGRMAEPKHVWLSLISTYVQGRMADTNPYDYPWFLHMYKEEWLIPIRMIIPDFYICTRKNDWAQTRTIIPDFCIWNQG
jgi:hypothetical protein